MIINEALVYRLIATQFPQWKNLSVRSVALSGWDNRTFHLGRHMLVRMPSAAEYAAQVEKEHQWLPRLAPLLSWAIPEPLAMGEPGRRVSLEIVIYRWLEGNTAAHPLIWLTLQLVSLNFLLRYNESMQQMDLLRDHIVSIEVAYLRLMTLRHGKQLLYSRIKLISRLR